MIFTKPKVKFAISEKISIYKILYIYIYIYIYLFFSKKKTILLQSRRCAVPEGLVAFHEKKSNA